MTAAAQKFPVQTGVLLEVVKDAANNVAAKPTKSVLALIGIAMGAASVIALLHISSNARSEAVRQFETIGADFVNIAASNSGRNAVPLSLDDIKNMPLEALGLLVASPVIQGGSVGMSPVRIFGVSEDFAALMRSTMKEGRFLSPFDGFETYAVIGAGVANGIAADRGSPVKPGQDIRLSGGELFQIVGVLEAQAPNLLLGVEPDNSVFVSVKAVRRLSRIPFISNVAARLAPNANGSFSASRIKDYFRQHARGADVNIVVASEWIASIGQQTRIYDRLLLWIGTISLIIGGIGIMNVMSMAVLERQEEIGLRLAVGASPNMIRIMFLGESVILAGVGCSAGVVLGVFAGWLAAGHSGWSFAFVPLSIPLGLAMAIVVGLFFGIYPAHRAASLRPIEALRRE